MKSKVGAADVEASGGIAREIGGTAHAAEVTTLSPRRTHRLTSPLLTSSSIARLVEWSVMSAPVVALAVLGYCRRWTTEDAFIDFRVVQHLLLGHGPVFNYGERVEAYTNPLWVALLTVWGALGGSLEHGAVIMGLVLTVGGAASGQHAAVRLARRSRGEPGVRHAVVLPVGTVVFAAIPVVWDFSTSGLETGLTFGWMGFSFWLLVDLAFRQRRSSRPRETPAAVVIGLGPLIRPDLAIFAGCYLLVLLGLAWTSAVGFARLAGAIRLAASAAAVPLAYELFRMAYFASVVPNTALAKKAGATYWLRGIAYVLDLVSPYYLLIPLVAIAAWWLIVARQLVKRRAGRVLALWTIPVLAAMLHVAYITRVGGDYMHGRLLLPGMFGGLIPVGAIALPDSRSGRWTSSALFVWVAAWAVVCAVAFRVPYAGGWTDYAVVDARGIFISRSGHQHPITVADLSGHSYAVYAAALRSTAGGSHMLVLDSLDRWDTPVRLGPAMDEFHQVRALPLAPWIPTQVDLVAVRRAVGLAGYVFEPNTWLVDRHGLGDPIAARLAHQCRGSSGHDKYLHDPWIAARFADPASSNPIDTDVEDARAALECGDLAALQQAITRPLTPRQILDNIRHSWRFTRLAIPADPQEARAVFCGGNAKP